HELPAGHHRHRWSPAWRRSAGRRRTAGSRLSPVHDPFQDLRPLAGTYASELAREAFSRGLVTTSPDGSRKAITPGATPVVLPARAIAERHALAQPLATAGFRMAQATVLGPSRELLLGALSPLERRLVERSAPRTRRLAISRVDFLVSSRPAALELNAT